MAATPVDICNLALGIIGDSRIQAMDEQRSKEAAECSRFYDQALDEALEAFDWPFARSYARGVSPSDVDVASGYAYAYGIPSDAIAIRGVARSMRGQVSPEFTLSSVAGPDGSSLRLMHTDRDGGVIVYTRRETFVPSFTPLFVAAVAAKLASYIAMPLTKSKEKRDDAEKKYMQTLEQAAVSVGNQGVTRLGGDVMPDWIEARG
ncbi:hypothetical protein [Microvirga mediterraneensis]|uniref:Uncharacterized protein n=1 Tax=Microvirga mediterraneensis TaxID=2754695 RepID=A0A838BXT3_9HYPH|nr:hypothetical protein [Microvirga mediterraneensis]MBA1159386.1 hypothetical protein [Microvirga mediterraneensis]